MSKPYDATSKFMTEMRPEDWLTFLGLPVFPVEIIDADLSTVTTAADKIIKVNDPDDPYCLHLDFQSSYDGQIDLRTLSYNVLAELRLQLRIVSVVIALSPRVISVRVTGGVYRNHALTQLDFNYALVKVWEIPAENFINSGIALMPLAPLSKIEKQELPGLIQRMKESVEAELNETEASSFWTATKIFMGLKFDAAYVDTLMEGVRNMRESTTYQAILKEGAEEARLEGRIEGRIEGEIKGELRLFKLIASKRFGAISEETERKLNAILTPEVIEAVSLQLEKFESWSELLEELN